MNRHGEWRKTIFDVTFENGIQGSLPSRLKRHVQGVAFTNRGIAISRNDKKHGEVILPNAQGQFQYRKLQYAHAGGIDAVGNKIAVPLYDHGNTSGYLCITHTDNYAERYFPLVNARDVATKPYAAAIERIAGGFICALVVEPDGRAIEWYRLPERSNGTLGDLVYLDTTEPEDKLAARNNIALHYLRGELMFYMMRAHRRSGTVTQQKVILGSANDDYVQLIDRAKWKKPNALLRLGPSSRFGATVHHYGTQGGIEILWTRTARNIGVWKPNKLAVQQDQIDFDWGAREAQEAQS